MRLANDQSKARKMADAVGARRRLAADKRVPLKNWVFYLDLGNNQKTRALHRKLQNLGGKIEQFLSKEVRCVITKNDIKGTQPLRRSPRRHKTNTPARNDKILTRAQGIIEKAKQKLPSKQKTSVVGIAKGLGIAVKHVDDVIAWLERIGGDGLVESSKQTRTLRSRNHEQQGASNVRQLRPPFLKVEDQSRFYQPLVKELDRWPVLDFESQPPNCPFDPPRSNRARSRSNYKTSSSSKGQQFNGQTLGATGNNGSSQKAGYCEVCKANYRGLKRHLRGIKHKKNAANREAYKELDQTVRQGRSVAKYFEDVKVSQSAKQSKRKATTADVGVQAGQKQVTPLKIIFSPRAGYSVVKSEESRHQTESVKKDNDDFVLKKAPRRRCVDDYSVVWMSELTMKIKRSTRVLRGPGFDQQGSVYVDFPIFKEQQNGAHASGSTARRDSPEDSAVITKYGDAQGKLRVSTRVLEAENHKGMEEFECPMYVQSSDL